MVVRCLQERGDFKDTGMNEEKFRRRRWSREKTWEGSEFILALEKNLPRTEKVFTG